MKIQFVPDPACREPRIEVHAPVLDENVSHILQSLTARYPRELHGYDAEGVRVIPMEDVLRVYTQSQHLYVQTLYGTWQLHAQLYETEQTLDPELFVRISRSEIVNIRRIIHLDVSLSHTIGVTLEGNVRTYVSRRCMKRLKQSFGL